MGNQLGDPFLTSALKQKLRCLTRVPATIAHLLMQLFQFNFFKYKSPLWSQQFFQIIRFSINQK